MSTYPVPPTSDLEQLLRFIVAADGANFMHKDMKIENAFVRNAENLQVADLVVGDFGAAQKGTMTVSGCIIIHMGSSHVDMLYSWT